MRVGDRLTLMHLKVIDYGHEVIDNHLGVMTYHIYTLEGEGGRRFYYRGTTFLKHFGKAWLNLKATMAGYHRPQTVRLVRPKLIGEEVNQLPLI